MKPDPSAAPPAAPPAAPAAKRLEDKTTLHGITRHDPYAWLKDPHWQDVMQDPAQLRGDIRAYLDAENAYTEATLQPTQDLQTELFEEMKGRIKQDDASVPQKDGAFAYFSRYRTGGEHPLFCRHAIDAPDTEEILLDGDALAKDQPYFVIGDCAHSPDHSLLAYSVDNAGSELYTIHFKALNGGSQPTETIPGITGALIWSQDGQTLFYTVLNENLRPHKVMRHTMGDDPSKDQLVYEEKDPGFFLGVDKSESNAFILISAHDHETSEVYVVPAEDATAAPRLIAPRDPGVEYEVTHKDQNFFILTNCDGAEDFKIVTTPVNAPGREHWQDFIPHEPGVLRLSFLAFSKHLVIMERTNALPRIRVIAMQANGTITSDHTITFEEEAYGLGLMPGYEFDTSEMRFSYSSPTTPSQVFDYNINTHDRILRKTQIVPSGHDPANYETRRIMATAKDGTRIPVTLLHKKGLVLNGTAPLLLYGYGSYGHTIPAGFSTARLSLVDRGFVYAIAHIRGGMECGYNWYTDGKLDKKTNTFTDFIASAEMLIQHGYTAKGKIVAHGGSAGGMLMGAIANMAPALFGGIIADVPFVDVLNTMCDADLPLTPPEWPEWGNPLEDKKAFDTIAAYSPYDNVRAQDYPAMLVTAGLCDPRVTYWEPAKWVAKLRATKTNDKPLLLKTHMEAGHGGASGRFQHLHEVALAYAFALWVI